MTDGGNGGMEVQDARKKPRHTVAVSPSAACADIKSGRQIGRKQVKALLKHCVQGFGHCRCADRAACRAPPAVCQDCMLRARTALALTS